MTALDFPTSPADEALYGSYIFDATRGVWNINAQGVVARYIVSATKPSPSKNGDAWFDSTEGITYIRYDDGTSAQWVETGNPVLSYNTLVNLTDTTIDTPIDGQALSYDSATSKWINETPATTLTGLTDTNIASPADGQSLVYNGSEWVNGSGATFGLFFKTDSYSVAFTAPTSSTVSIKAGTRVEANGKLVTFASATAVTMPSLTAGTDYYIYVKDDGTAEAVAATGAWPTPVASPPSVSRLVGGFHYAPGGNAAARAGGDTTAAINPYSLWDIKWSPACQDPRGMTLVNDHFWSDIYLLNTGASSNGTSKNNATIWDTRTWWDTTEELGKYGKRLPRYREFADLAFGTTEANSRGNDPVTTGLGTTNSGSSNADNKFTSKWGVIQSSGVLYSWGDEFGGGNAGASWTANTGGRGSTYQQENAVLLGAAWGDSVYSGSRSSNWLYSPTTTADVFGGRGVCDHLKLV